MARKAQIIHNLQGFDPLPMYNFSGFIETKLGM